MVENCDAVFFEGDGVAGAVNNKVALHADTLRCCVRHENDGVARLRSGNGFIERCVGLLTDLRHNASGGSGGRGGSKRQATRSRGGRSGCIGSAARCRGCSVRRSAAFRCGCGCRWAAARCGNRGRSSAFLGLDSSFDSSGSARTGCEFVGVRRGYRAWRNGKANGKNEPSYNNITTERT